GRLTDGQGRTVDFRNTIIIMTSNLGSSYVNAASDKSEANHHRVMEALRENFRPEFLNRIDEIIIFDQLTREQIREIVEIQLNQVNKRLAERRMSITLTKEALELVSTLGYDPMFGARPLKRVIQKQLLDPLAMKLLNGTIHEGEEIIVRVNDGALEFHGTMTAAPIVA
ncbi:MAG: AAA family ATPase, partial [Thermomicrobiales bacterium]